MRRKIYAMYRGDELLCTGTVYEIAEKMDISVSTVRFYSMPAYRKRIENRGKFENQRVVIKID